MSDLKGYLPGVHASEQGLYDGIVALVEELACKSVSSLVAAILAYLRRVNGKMPLDPEQLLHALVCGLRDQPRKAVRVAATVYDIHCMGVEQGGPPLDLDQWLDLFASALLPYAVNEEDLDNVLSSLKERIRTVNKGQTDKTDKNDIHTVASRLAVETKGDPISPEDVESAFRLILQKDSDHYEKSGRPATRIMVLAQAFEGRENTGVARDTLKKKFEEFPGDDPGQTVTEAIYYLNKSWAALDVNLQVASIRDKRRGKTHISYCLYRPSAT